MQTDTFVLCFSHLTFNSQLKHEHWVNRIERWMRLQWVIHNSINIIDRSQTIAFLIICWFSWKTIYRWVTQVAVASYPVVLLKWSSVRCYIIIVAATCDITTLTIRLLFLFILYSNTPHHDPWLYRHRVYYLRLAPHHALHVISFLPFGVCISLYQSVS